MKNEVSRRFRFLTYSYLLPAVVFSLCETGVASAQDPQQQWIGVGPCLGTTCTYVKALVLDPSAQSTIYGGLVEDNSGHPFWGVIKSVDGGNTWTGLNTGPIPDSGVMALAMDPTTVPSTVYAGLSGYYLGIVGGGGVFKSTDGGTTWIEVDTGLSTNFGVLMLANDPLAPSTLYAGSDRGGLYKSTDGGSTWGIVNGFPATRVVYAFAIAINPVTLAETLYAGTDGGGIYISADGGMTWTPAGAGLPNYLGVLVVAIDPMTPSTMYAGLGGYYGGTETGALFKSTDGGATWSDIDSAPLPTTFDVHTIAINPMNTSLLYVGYFGGGAFISADGGQTWSDFNSGLTDPYVHSIVINPVTPTTVYAGTCNAGVFVLRSSGDPPSENQPYEGSVGRRRGLQR